MFKKLILSFIFLLMSHNLFSMLELSPECIKYPEGMVDSRLLYSMRNGFFVYSDGFICHVNDDYVQPDLIGLHVAELLIKIGSMWTAKYQGREFLITRLSEHGFAKDMLLGMEDLPEEIRATIRSSMPKPSKLEVYFPEENRLGVRIADES